MGLSAFSADFVAQWVADSCAAQQLPVKVTDPVSLRQVGVLLGVTAGGAGAQARSAAPAPPDGALDAPHDADARRVPFRRAGGAGSDDRVIDHGGDDGVLLGEVTACPGAA